MTMHNEATATWRGQSSKVKLVFFAHYFLPNKIILIFDTTNRHNCIHFLPILRAIEGGRGGGGREGGRGGGGREGWGREGGRGEGGREGGVREGGRAG